MWMQQRPGGQGLVSLTVLLMEAQGRIAHTGQPQLYRAEQEKGEKGSESKAAPPSLRFSDSALKL